jgi:tetratricopeptide (TPR) repeat protein
MLPKIRFSWLLIPCLLCAGQLWADTIKLKSGEIISGTIKDETPTEVTIEIQLSASITDERVVEKSDITDMQKEQPDEVLYKQLIAVQPNPQSSYSSDAYSQILARLSAFEVQYPSSSYLPEIKQLAATFQDEKNRVDAGEIKFLGAWLSKDEAARRSGQINAQALYGQMEQQASGGDLVGAMQTYDNIERTYPSTRAYPAAVELALRVLAALKQDMTNREQAIAADEAQLKATLAATAEPMRTQMAQAAQAEQDQDALVVAQAVKSGAIWTPLIPRSRVSIDTLQKVAQSEYSHISSIQLAAMEQSISKVDAARDAMSIGNLNQAGDLLQQASQLWSNNEDARYVQGQLDAKIAAAAPTPTPKPKASPKPKATPATQVIVPIKAATPAPVATPTAVSSAVETPAPTPAEAARPFLMTVPGALSVVAVALVIAGIGAIITQRRARQHTDAEYPAE